MDPIQPEDKQPQTETPQSPTEPQQPNSPQQPMAPTPSLQSFPQQPAQNAPMMQPVPRAEAPRSPSVGLAVASLVTGIVGFLTGIFFIGALIGLVAVVLGIIALSLKHGGKGMSIAGIVLGSLAILFVMIIMIIGFSFSESFNSEPIQNDGINRQY